MTTQTDIQANLPLTEATVFIMLSLAAAPKHGYAIMQEVESLSDERVVLSTGTLYGALKRLLEQDWIERVDDATGEATGRTRKVYTLTEVGRRILNAEVDRLQALVATAQLRTAGGEA
jgi:DNA-binding PadR family transcriptional regulator